MLVIHDLRKLLESDIFYRVIASVCNGTNKKQLLVRGGVNFDDLIAQDSVN